MYFSVVPGQDTREGSSRNLQKNMFSYGFAGPETRWRFLRSPKNVFPFSGVQAGGRGGGEEEECSARLTMFEACQSNVFCLLTRHAAYRTI